MSLDGQIETTETIAAETVGAALEHDGGGPIELHDVVDDELEYVEVVGVGDALLERHVDRVVAAVVGADLVHVARAREERVAVLVKRHGHDAVGQVEGLLHAVAVVYVDVDVENARVILEQLEDGDVDVVYVAEARRLELFSVMQTARPVHRYIALLSFFVLFCFSSFH